MNDIHMLFGQQKPHQGHQAVVVYPELVHSLVKVHGGGLDAGVGLQMQSSLVQASVQAASTVARCRQLNFANDGLVIEQIKQRKNMAAEQRAEKERLAVGREQAQLEQQKLEEIAALKRFEEMKNRQILEAKIRAQEAERRAAAQLELERLEADRERERAVHAEKDRLFKIQEEKREFAQRQKEFKAAQRAATGRELTPEEHGVLIQFKEVIGPETEAKSNNYQLCRLLHLHAFNLSNASQALFDVYGDINKALSKAETKAMQANAEPTAQPGEPSGHATVAPANTSQIVCPFCSLPFATTNLAQTHMTQLHGM